MARDSSQTSLLSVINRNEKRPLTYISKIPRTLLISAITRSAFFRHHSRRLLEGPPDLLASRRRPFGFESLRSSVIENRWDKPIPFACTFGPFPLCLRFACHSRTSLAKIPPSRSHIVLTGRDVLAETVGFEPTCPGGQPHFECGSL